jgi:hypothetical protein
MDTRVLLFVPGGLGADRRGVPVAPAWVAARGGGQALNESGRKHDCEARRASHTKNSGHPELALALGYCWWGRFADQKDFRGCARRIPG